VKRLLDLVESLRMTFADLRDDLRPETDLSSILGPEIADNFRRGLRYQVLFIAAATSLHQHAS